MRSNYLTLILIIFLTSCASTRPPITPPVNTSFTVQINQPFDSLPNYSRIYFQNGMQIPKGGLDRWTTYCRLHVFNPDKKADYLTSVAPGDFALTKVFGRVESSDGPTRRSGFYGSVGVGLYSASPSAGLNWSRGDGPPSYYLYRVVMRLSSTEQPDVQTLICSKKWSTRGNYYPRLSEIRQALGEQIQLIPLSISRLYSHRINLAQSVL